jgi:hypothetical protein
MEDSIVTETVKGFQNELDIRNTEALQELNKQIDELASLPLCGALPQYNDSLYVEQPPDSFNQTHSPTKFSPVRDFQNFTLQLDKDIALIEKSKIPDCDEYSFNNAAMAHMTQDTEALFARAEQTDDDSPLRLNKTQDFLDEVKLHETSNTHLSDFTKKLEAIQREDSHVSHFVAPDKIFISDHEAYNIPPHHAHDHRANHLAFAQDETVSHSHKNAVGSDNLRVMNAVPVDENSRGILNLIKPSSMPFERSKNESVN